MVALLIVYLKAEPFTPHPKTGWLEGEFKWVKMPAYLKIPDKAPPPNATLVTIMFSNKDPKLVSIENVGAKKRLVMRNKKATVEATTEASLVETLEELWAIKASDESLKTPRPKDDPGYRFEIRNGSATGEWLAGDNTKTSMAKTKFSKWIFEPTLSDSSSTKGSLASTNTFLIRTQKEPQSRYLAVVSNSVTTVSEAEMKKNKKAATWQLEEVLGSAIKTSPPKAAATKAAATKATATKAAATKATATKAAATKATATKAAATKAAVKVTTKPTVKAAKKAAATKAAVKVTTKPTVKAAKKAAVKVTTKPTVKAAVKAAVKVTQAAVKAVVAAVTPKPTQKKPVVPKAPVKKPVVPKSPVKKPVKKPAVPKAPVKKPAAPKSPVKKPVTKPVVPKSPVKKPVKKPAAPKSPVKKPTGPRIIGVAPKLKRK
ncbi:hypothetical protein D9Q98_004041 [Chlorella vulgaris]|uniref:Uncharacterized protein n=1 Tax=Chlorella vulgaris TaxID=3077 RepID=A0A9D4YYN6_CHLVU|nr:hypothetical protein D9Q98_004041 [Chlorella vulgaris]